MTGRGVDQALPHPSDPTLRETYVKSALQYLELAERANGPIPRPVDASYLWGDAIAEWRRMAPDVRLMNLETSVTKSSHFAPKGINYRMSPDNVACLTAAGVDCCVLANNHVLDFGTAGLLETLEVLRRLGVEAVGAGRGREEAAAPAAIPTREGAGRVIVVAAAFEDSGVPPGWRAGPQAPGVNLIEPTKSAAAELAGRLEAVRRPGDVAVASIHWGSNWGYEVPDAHRRFAHALIDSGQVAIVHGHSSHHPRPIEVYRNRLILYGCGDFLNDYEGISGYDEFRSELVAMYFADINPTSGDLVKLTLSPMTIRRFQLHQASPEDAGWFGATMTRESRKFGVHLAEAPDGRLSASWKPPSS